MVLEGVPGVVFDPTLNSLSDNWAVRSVDMNNLLSCVATGTILPSATITTYGTALTLAPAAPHLTVRPFSVHGAVAGIAAGETVTFRITATNEDATTKTATLAITANGAWAFTAASLATLFTAAKKLTSIAVAVQSSIASSAARATAIVVGLNGG